MFLGPLVLDVRALASRWRNNWAINFDTDDFYWQPKNPPFAVRKEAGLRNAALFNALRQNSDWVLAGSYCAGWGVDIFGMLSLAVFVDVPTDIRLARLRAREENRYGARVQSGGDMHVISEAFLTWATAYDEGHFPGRSRARQEAWFNTLECPKLVVDNTGPFAQVMRGLVARIEALRWLPGEAR